MRPTPTTGFVLHLPGPRDIGREVIEDPSLNDMWDAAKITKIIRWWLT